MGNFHASRGARAVCDTLAMFLNFPILVPDQLLLLLKALISKHLITIRSYKQGVCAYRGSVSMGLHTPLYGWF